MAASTDPLRGVIIGAGYFSQYHFEAWQRLPDVELAALCDSDAARARAASEKYGIARIYPDAQAMLDAERPDFVDVITGPASHLEICRLAGDRGIDVICQKPLAPTHAEATTLVETAARAGIRLMVHDNFRFQPWHRELRALCDAGTIGSLHAIACRSRMGDGWGTDAYLARQPYFRTMPRLLIVETGVHIIDVFRYLGGDIRRVFATLRRLNRVIAGEDCGIVLFDFHNGATGLWDANRYNESLSQDPRFTFGEFLIEGSTGSLRVDEEGGIIVHPLGQPPAPHDYPHERRGFAGDCVYATLRHFVECLRSGAPFETDGREYLKTLAVQEAVYASNASGLPVDVSDSSSLRPRDA